jgi:hypothetical protein
MSVAWRHQTTCLRITVRHTELHAELVCPRAGEHGPSGSVEPAPVVYHAGVPGWQLAPPARSGRGRRT